LISTVHQTNFKRAETFEFSTLFQHGITKDVSFAIKLKV